MLRWDASCTAPLLMSCTWSRIQLCVSGTHVRAGADGAVPEPCVVHAAFSGDGQALATVEIRPDAGAVRCAGLCVCMCMFVHAWAWVCACVCASMSLCLCARVCVHLCARPCVCASVCTCACVKSSRLLAYKRNKSPPLCACRHTAHADLGSRNMPSRSLCQT